MYKCKYKTPCEFDDIIMKSDGSFLTGLWFEHSDDIGLHLGECEEKRLPVFDETALWLNEYFSGGIPDFTPEYRITGVSDFCREVLEILIKIPYGTTVSYKNIADETARKRGISVMSAQAVGGAVGRNPVSIIIPCHRVVGSDGSLTGYSGGIKNKISLLNLEKVTFKP